ncbi:MAG TPA: DUF6496 domain-containing protein [Gammaproteobacteria bacterium]|nr:DUF6496 domain-containing protein [Gammaproteobacteria bacterium]
MRDLAAIIAPLCESRASVSMRRPFEWPIERDRSRRGSVAWHDSCCDGSIIGAGKIRMARKYGKKASKKVERAMRERKRGKLRSGSTGKKVTSRKQAIAIGLAEARREGAKVPEKPGGKKEKKKKSKKKGSAKKKGTKKKATKKRSSKKKSSKKKSSKKKTAGKKRAKKSTRRRKK